MSLPRFHIRHKLSQFQRHCGATGGARAGTPVEGNLAGPYDFHSRSLSPTECTCSESILCEISITFNCERRREISTIFQGWASHYSPGCSFENPEFVQHPFQGLDFLARHVVSVPSRFSGRVPPFLLRSMRMHNIPANKKLFNLSVAFLGLLHDRNHSNELFKTIPTMVNYGTCTATFYRHHDYADRLHETDHWPECETCTLTFLTLRARHQYMNAMDHVAPKFQCDICIVSAASLAHNRAVLLMKRPRTHA